MLDPEPPHLGFRVTEGRVEVLIPRCPGESLTGVRGADVTRKRRELFDAAAPISPAAAAGRVVVLGTSASGGPGWVPEDFAERTVHEEAPVLPRLLEVGYRSALADASGVADTANAAAEVRAPDQYWTRKGPRTAEQIDRQFRCNRQARRKEKGPGR
ncbi:hypothetical protein ABTX81_17305 [Kitasatospora sp. NPDC097605]|uniref:hypothetical protein n=1 Tax=Kitasatospora sp. NPDC097605 TaxID=3157226 RepID=UPI0033307AA4